MMMKKLILIYLLSNNALAEPFIDFGIGVHANNDRPEVSLSNPLGIVEAGYNINQYTIKYTHISGINEREQGYGFNMISIHFRLLK